MRDLPAPASPSATAILHAALPSQQQARMLAFIRRRMSSQLRALFEPEDVLQDVFVIAHQDLSRRGALSRPWLREHLDPKPGQGQADPHGSQTGLTEGDRSLEATEGKQALEAEDPTNAPETPVITTEAEALFAWLRGIATHRILGLSRSMQPRSLPRKETAIPPSMWLGSPPQSDGSAPLPLSDPQQIFDSLAQDDLVHDPLVQEEMRDLALERLCDLKGEQRVHLVLRGLLKTSWATIAFLTERNQEACRKLHQRCTQDLRSKFLP